jgi:hypothetical protein
VTQFPGGYHYEYAVYNQNLDRAIQSFQVAFPDFAPILDNIGFHAAPQHPGWAHDGTVGDAGYSSAPWTYAFDPSPLFPITWSCETFAQNPNANAIRWGTLYSFRFDSSAPPAASYATIGFFKTGSPISVNVPAPFQTDASPTPPPPTPTVTPTPTPTVTPTPTPTPGQITLTASGRRVQGRHTVDLTWSGATSANIDIYRDGVVIATVPNTGSYKDFIGVRGGNVRYAYRVCEAGTQNCSNHVTVRLDPMGITGTPIVDLASRALFLDAMTTPDGGKTKKHFIFSLNVDTGDTNSGWPVDVEATATFNGMTFTAGIQQQRPALGIVDNILYVPYGSMGDCGLFHGWLVGVPIDNPASVTAWATSAIGGGIWGVGGVASEGMNPFITTGNTFNTGGNWGGGEAVIRFQPGPIFTGSPTDYWVPVNWLNLDNKDWDLAGSGPLLVDVPGATPSNLVVALGKDANAYLLNRENLGGIGAPVASSQVSDSNIIQAAVTYRTKQGTYVAFRASTTALSAFRITATNPPTIAARGA